MCRRDPNNIVKALELNYSIEPHPSPRLAPTGSYRGCDPDINKDFKN